MGNETARGIRRAERASGAKAEVEKKRERMRNRRELRESERGREGDEIKRESEKECSWTGVPG